MPASHFQRKHSQTGLDCHLAAPSASQGQSLPQRQCRSLSAGPANSQASRVKLLCEVLWACHQRQKVPECAGSCAQRCNRSCQRAWAGGFYSRMYFWASMAWRTRLHNMQKLTWPQGHVCFLRRHLNLSDAPKRRHRFAHLHPACLLPPAASLQPKHPKTSASQLPCCRM